MPGYIGYRPQFDPVSLQEYLTVPTMIIEDYKEAEKEFNDYQDKAEQLAAMVGEDPYGRKIIDNYRNQLQGATNAISDGRIQNVEGLRQALGARKYYRENLMPLEVGIPYWEQYKKAKLALGEDPLEDPLTLESFVRNPAQAYSLTKGSDVRNLAANMAKAASARRIKDPEYMGKVLGNNYYRTKSEAGFSDQEIQDWINGAPNPELDEIRNEVQKQYGNISPEKLNRFINEGVYLGAIYDKKFEDKAVPKVTTSGSGTGTGNGSNVIDWEKYVNSLISGDGINVVDRNLFRPTTATNANGNLIESVSDDGTVIIKSPMKIVGSLYSPIGNSNDIFNNINDMINIIGNVKDDNLKNKWLGELNKLSKQAGNGDSRSKKLESNRAAYDNIAKEVIQHVFLHKNTDGTYSLNYNKSTDGSIDLAPFKNKLKGSLFAGTRGNMRDIIQQLESAGITNKDKFKDVNDFIATLDNAYNRSGSFRNKGMTTAFDFQYSEDEKDRKLENIQGDWRVMDDASFEKGYLQYSTKPFSLNDKTELFKRRKEGKVSYKHEFNVVETPEGPQNFHAVHVEDRASNKHYTLVFTPDQWNGYRTNAESMASYNNDVQKMQIYLHGTPQQLKQIGSSLVMSIDDINRNIQRCLENNDVKNARLWEALKQKYYYIMTQEGVPQNIAETNRALKASALEGSTVIGRYNQNSEKADRNAN